MVDIIQDQNIRSGDPCIAGTRITVFDIKSRVIDEGADPHVVAGEYDISMEELFSALAYYYAHQSDLHEREREFAAARVAGEQRARNLLSREDELSERAG